MATTNPEVMALVEEELRKDPDLTTRELFEKAKEIDPKVSELSSRQFHGRYPLQVKRRMAPRRPRKPRRRATRKQTRRAPAREASVNDHGAIRGILIQFAKEIVAAEDKAQIVGVVGDVDRYVERIVKATEAA